VPTELERWQPQRLLTSDVPLGNLPPTLGVDRALAAWGAWQQQRQPVLVADAGTALSLTLVDAAGCFLGGRLMAGGRLQLQALHQGTADLPQLEPVEAAGPLWAAQTSEAMASGVARGLAAAIALAFHDRPQPQWPWQLWLTGGDAPVLMPLLQAQGLQPHHDEGLALAALVALSRPAQDL
jgi:type III pantothenate kinase